MAIRVSLDHRTTYRYERPVTLSPQIIRLRPAPHNRTPIHHYSLDISPSEHFINWQQDPNGNFLARVVFPKKVDHFQISVNLVADLDAYNPFDFFLEEYAQKFPFEYSTRDRTELAPFLIKEPASDALLSFMARVDRTQRGTVDFLVDLNRLVANTVAYVIRMEPGVQTPEETLTLGRGSCRDSSWLLVQACRQLGLAARFVSGYLVQLEPDEVPLEGPRGPTEDFTDLHAWCEVFVPGAGWIGLDPTSGLLASEGHIPVACTPEPSSAAPIEGFAEKADSTFDFSMSVTRVVNVPRITKPYSDEAWQAILERGYQVDEVLKSEDLRLTMGGEPTFVSIDEPDAPEWNVAALGGNKFTLADRLARKLHPLWNLGGMFHHGQGKWYPGEQLPRWAISLVSRKDGEPIWSDIERFARPDENLGHSSREAELFIQELIKILGVSTEGLMPAYEDVWYYMWREKRLPKNVDPLESNIEDPLERERLRRVFHQGLSHVVGYALPLAHNGFTFYSGSWFLRHEHCFLIPGDSPMGFRLPLDSILWEKPGDRLDDYPVDPTVKLPPLPPREQLGRRDATRPPISYQLRYSPAQQPGSAGPGALGPESGQGLSLDGATSSPYPGGIVRTALCAEAREGILRIFMPPFYSTEVYLELVRAVETAATNLNLKIMLEGYPPPSDPRLRVTKITPDPGVIEVNVPPTSTFEELVQQTQELYESARQVRLTAEKFEVDGKHIGSGGGNHLTLGADYTLDSPFLRRPDLLRSLISFWHNHPALSFLFAGQFIGPTSQAPRVDEARNDAIYELEVAFKELERQGNSPPPWIVDRLLRNILVDVTGNTHRTEFCIDKLYSPDSSTGRLGLLEMRAFEMPPHHRMATAQHLLLRSVLAAFSKNPYKEELVKWGTSLHDKFMLPHFVRRDLADALRYLSERGLHLDPEWFDPHYQFRFPFYGKVTSDDISLELRGALEPWHVLGEETSVAGQARYVDSSLERIQVRVRGATPGRHAVTCNGTLVPLHPTGTHGEYVAGVRYRAWQPPSCLHPTIGIHSPLHFSVYDRWNQRAIFGCTYHVVHPGGRAAEERPVNAAAAESRRIARFDAAGHTAGRYVPECWGVNPHFPMTLDLRRFGG
ncbi:MAG: IMP dehydrogenase [Sorangiineae bacterium NIC37A_2]|nr:MAG: IMP dehydrogenase [Sorangiineae bacterium NIC37A_2]